MSNGTKEQIHTHGMITICVTLDTLEQQVCSRVIVPFPCNGQEEAKVTNNSSIVSTLPHPAHDNSK